MKSIVVCALALLCLAQFVNTQCSAGYYEVNDGYGSGGKICRQCGVTCTACDANGACTTAIAANGLVAVVSGGSTSFTSVCASSPSGSPDTYLAQPRGYNIGTDKCDRCMDGCTSCYVDYDKCTGCVSGYEFHRDSMTCARAELGLGAVVLALSILVLVLSIIGCIKAKQ